MKSRATTKSRQQEIASVVFIKAGCPCASFTALCAKKEVRDEKVLFSLLFVFVFVSFANAEDLGNLSTNPYDSNSISNPYGAGNPYNPIV